MGKLSGGRLHLRLPPELYKNVLSLGEALGFDAPADAGRYFLTVGVQQSLAQLKGGKPKPTSSTHLPPTVASFPDMFPADSAAKKSLKSDLGKPAARTSAKRPAQRSPSSKK